MTVPSMPDNQPAARGSWLKWLLIASLAVNLLIIGSALGHRFFGHGHWRGGRGESIGVMGYVRHLDRDRRQTISKILSAGRPNLRELREEVRQARLAAAETIAAEPFDKAKVEAALAAIAAADQKLRTAGTASIVDAVEAMTSEERRGLVEWWKSRRPHHFREPPEPRRERREPPG
jgi:uncharacterized membrane protein